jgi:hypothetical protein
MLSINKKYSVRELDKAFNLSTVLKNSIQIYFGDPISIKELSQISMDEFLRCKNLGRKRWKELQNILQSYPCSESAVKFIKIQGANNITVEIDISKPFHMTVKELSEIINKFV